MNIEEKVKRILSIRLGIYENNIDNDMKLCGDLDADSLDLVELVMDIEDEFNIYLQKSDTDPIEENLDNGGDYTVTQLIDMITANTEE